MMIRTRRVGLAVVAIAALAGTLALPANPASAGEPDGAGQWVTAWAASPMAATPTNLASPEDFSAAGFTDRTIRNIVWTSVGGRSARIRLSNLFGTGPVTFNEVDVGIARTGAALVPGTSHSVTFGGRRSVTLAPGTERLSDPVFMTVPGQTDLAVSLFSRNPTGPATYHSDAQQNNFVSTPGNSAGSASADSFTTPSQHWYFVDSVEVRAPAARGTVVAFGDSITDGFRSTVDGNARWPNDLARLLAASNRRTFAVADQGISGDRVLSDSACFGGNALARFARDAIIDSHARVVIMLIGINDIGFSQLPNSGCSAPNTDVSAAQIIAGYKVMIAMAHAAGVRIIGGTLTPFQGAGYYSVAGEAKRENVNQWIRASGAFDGVVDFDRTVRDPANPLVVLPAFDRGDHLHPNDAGYQAMATAAAVALDSPR
ncbi:MAG TPA: SGNH/GDSL hydrolase family protein [Pseudonocardiaceae bacterium]|nr:SGNH/GDSL hydrolase family protein [Pseudonocardiaceae bacterium]